ncbi:hypothetical protein NDA14_003286 [Ustilago hordei]|nr:hypothetical protein NDA14_003286 [Ustilago hordei]
MTNKEDAKNLGYLEVNLFDEMDQGSLSEYMDMEPTVNMDESQDLEALTNRLEAMGMWEVMDLPPGMNTVDTKWVLEVKTDANLVPTKFKARLMARGFCHGPGCSRSRRVMGSYGRSTGIEDLVDTSREHGRSAVSMETMDSYGLTCKGGPSTATRRTKLKEQAQPRGGPSSRSRHSHEEDQAQGACRWLPLRGSRDKSQRNCH